MIEKYGYNGFTNWENNEVVVEKKPFENRTIRVIEHQYCDSFERKISTIVSQLRSRKTDYPFEVGNIDEAINSLSRFVSLMGNDIDRYQEEIQFDMDLLDSIEITFQGHGITRFNLMFTELNTIEEAYLFYLKDGRPTQVNGSLPIMVDLLKQVL